MSEPARTRWSAADIETAVGGRLTDGADWTATGVSIDTRTLKPGDLFIALKDIRDGHDFVPDAMARGAAASLVSRTDCGPGPKILVEDVLDGLRQLGVAGRARSSAIRIAVTGSVGKTSVKEAIAAVLRLSGPAHWSVKSYNNHWGVPLTLSRMPEDTRRGVFEMGMNHAGEIRDLSALVRPHVALITRIGPAHLENLGSIENIARAKSEIFEGMETDGAAVLPADDPLSEILYSHAKQSRAAFLLDFGSEKGAAVRILDFESDHEGGRGCVDVMGVVRRFSIGASGAHWGWNAAAVFAACAGAGLEPDLAVEALADVAPEGGRGRAVRIKLPRGGEFTLLDDAYNANPVSMAAAIGALGDHPTGSGGKRIAVLGDILELGPEAARLHAELAGPLDAAGVDAVFTCGSLITALNDALPQGRLAGYWPKAEAGLGRLIDAIEPGDVVLVKGSNASGLHKIAAKLADGSAFAVTET
jgi:UDP-N-acetylmuramoyl-tripeptide--D-alanyl-D-alanine ligase